MKPSHHPPLYLLTATLSFFAGATLGTDEPALPHRASVTGESGVAVTADTFASPSSNRATRPTSRSETRGAETAEQVASPLRQEPPADTALGVAAQTRQQAAKSYSGNGASASVSSPSSSSPSSAGAAANGPPVLKTRYGDVEIFTADNPWNQDISGLPVRDESSTWIRSVGKSTELHPDFGTVWNGAPNGVPYVIVPPDQPKVPVQFEYDDESDPGPYPIPPGVPIEGGPDAPYDSDRHVILIDPQNRMLYELFQAIPDPIFGWRAGSGAIFDLSSDSLRPDGWTSADAAGLPVFPGLVRYEEVAAGEIRHALRFTVERTQRAYIHPARHFASRDSDPTLPPMGLRVRLRADYDISGFPRSAQVILRALKKYGMFLADNGSDWFITGAPDPRWNDDDLATLKRVKGADFECVDTGQLKR